MFYGNKRFNLILIFLWSLGLLQCQMKDAKRILIVQKGKGIAVQLTGNNWEQDSDALVGKGIANVAFIDQYVMDTSFRMSVTLSLDTLNASTALAWVFGNHIGFDSNSVEDSNKQRIFFYSPSLPEVRYFDQASQYIVPGMPFDFELLREKDSLFVYINKQKVIQVPLEDLAGPLSGAIGLRPWRNTMHIYEWTFEGATQAPPRLNYVFESGDEGYDLFALPAIIETTPGTLLAFCEGRRGAWYNDMGDIDLVMKRSMDGGETWSPLSVVLDDGPHSCQNPVPIYDPIQHRLVLVSTRKSANDLYSKVLSGEADEAIRVRVMYADSMGNHWTTPKDITTQVKPDSMNWYATGPGSGLRMTSTPYTGRMVVACNHTVQGDPQYRAHVIYSDDGGENWEVGGSIPGKGLNEGEVAELDNGDLYINMRNYDLTHHARRISYSEDGGLTWSPAQFDLELPEPRAQASTQSVNWQGRKVLAFSNPDHPYFRQNMTLKLSYDGGKSWPDNIALYPGPSANSDIVQLNDNTIGVLYQAGRFTYTDGIVFERVSDGDSNLTGD